ncbi:ABC transporter permease subunit [Nisaea acidiphila]|uniref:ABC transporter permease subunit n=1 Tax=Nisaea acidiphila TaxID=1862145 RepID=A0A9J7AVC2_9PROT|nr:ABC transporter permease subunit [Nisaea acidiphila]UUX51715.1 ABC transporter permease subunit [Nisaea acidiphila]
MRLINQKVSRPAGLLLAAIPFIAIIILYVSASEMRLAENPQDKLLPSLARMGETFWRMATVPDRRSGELLLWKDTAASLSRLGAGVGISALLALLLGVPIGLIPKVRAVLSSFIATFSLIPPITVLPILFIAAGLGEVSKVALIIIGTAPVMIRAIALAVAELPAEILVKAQTLGASTWQIILRVVLPQIWPKLVVAIRLGLVPAWIFLISAEAIASTEGLGYRIFLVRRYLAMDVILPYVAWITLIAFLLDRTLLQSSKKLFRWAHLSGESF